MLLVTPHHEYTCTNNTTSVATNPIHNPHRHHHPQRPLHTHLKASSISSFPPKPPRTVPRLPLTFEQPSNMSSLTASPLNKASLLHPETRPSSSSTSGPSRPRPPRPSLSSPGIDRAQRRPIPRSTSAYVRSPSRLPNTDTMSYFPPFETMGSTSGDEETQEESSEELRATHGKGRSLSSLAGIMSFLSPGALSPPSRSMTSSPVSADGAAVQALSKRFWGKRRVLEPMTMANEEEPKVRPVGQHKRRLGSEVEVDNLLARRRDRVTSAKIDDELVVESLVGESRAPLSLPAFPTWRYPMPSPPVARLCPELPTEAFANPIPNPLKPTQRQSRRSSASTVRSQASHASDDCDRVEDDLSPTVSTSVQSLSNPETPKEKSLPVKITFASPEGRGSPRGGSMKEEKWWREKMDWDDGEKTIKARGRENRQSWGVEMSPRATSVM